MLSGLFFSHTAPLVYSLGVHRKLGEHTARIDDLNWSEGYPTPYGIILSNRRWTRNGGTFGVTVPVFPSSCCTWWALKSWKCLNFCLPMWSSELIACFYFLEHATFTILTKLSLFMTHKFPPCYPSSSLPHPTGGEWTTVVPSCLQGLSHQKYAGPSPINTLCMFLKSVLLSYPTEVNHIIQYSYKICRIVTLCHRHSQKVPVKEAQGSGKTQSFAWFYSSCTIR